MEYLMNTPILPGILPGILLVEDNPISREFLHEALRPLGFSIDIAETLTAARILARQYKHALFLSDVHLPDGGPDEIFSALRQLQENTIVIAITAEAQIRAGLAVQSAAPSHNQGRFDGLEDDDCVLLDLLGRCA